MRRNLVKFAGLAGGAVALLLLVAAPTLSAASMAHDASPYQDRATMPQNCPHCVLTDAGEVVKQFFPNDRLITGENIDFLLSPTSLTSELWPNKGIPFHGDIAPPSPPSPFVEYHCRNLNSEDPPL